MGSVRAGYIKALGRGLKEIARGGVCHPLERGGLFTILKTVQYFAMQKQAMLLGIFCYSTNLQYIRLLIFH